VTTRPAAKMHGIEVPVTVLASRGARRIATTVLVLAAAGVLKTSPVPSQSPEWAGGPDPAETQAKGRETRSVF
jgi:hypothetical protein